MELPASLGLHFAAELLCGKRCPYLKEISKSPSKRIPNLIRMLSIFPRGQHMLFLEQSVSVSCSDTLKREVL